MRLGLPVASREMVRIEPQQVRSGKGRMAVNFAKLPELLGRPTPSTMAVHSDRLEHHINEHVREVSLDPLRWGLIPYWCEDPKGGRRPINAKCETVRTLPTFRDAYRRRRCIVPVDGFFEWKAIKSQKAKQPHAIAM